MGLVYVDTPKVEISRQTQKRRQPWSVCRQTLEKLDQNNYLKWLKAANKWFKRCSGFVQHGGRPSAFRQNSADCQSETNSSFQMQMIKDSRSNHHVHWLQLANFSLNELLLRLFLDKPICFLEILILLMCHFWRSNIEFEQFGLIVPKNHHKHTSLLIFQVIGGNFSSFASNFCVFNHIFSSKIMSKTRKSDSK